MQAIIRIYKWWLKLWEAAAVDGTCREDNSEGKEHRGHLIKGRET